MRAVIIGNGTVRSYEKIKKYIKADDFIICADGGINHAVKMDIKPDILIGDFDSSNPELVFEDVGRIEYPARKDFTDGELCVKYAAEHGYDEVLLLAMTGTRADHTLNNMLMLSQCEHGMSAEEYNEIYYLKNKIIIENKEGMTLSIIPVKGNLTGITTKGLEYPLNNEALYFGESRGNSNVIISDYCEITVSGGEGLVILNNGE
ncbi:MAG: thiamine diphosphokinase [bacterium]|nr:thiamine diphosphokinase [bacterium]